MLFISANVYISHAIIKQGMVSTVFYPSVFYYGNDIFRCYSY